MALVFLSSLSSTEESTPAIYISMIFVTNLNLLTNLTSPMERTPDCQRSIHRNCITETAVVQPKEVYLDPILNAI